MTADDSGGSLKKEMRGKFEDGMAYSGPTCQNVMSCACICMYIGGGGCQKVTHIQLLHNIRRTIV